MTLDRRIDRRRFLRGLLPAVGAASLSGCDALARSPFVRDILDVEEAFTEAAQRLFLGRRALAREFSESDISPDFRANGSTDPDSIEYRAMAAGGFADWKLKVGGLVERPTDFTLAELRAMPARTQITRHDCVEGWSCIGKWTGVPLSAVANRVGLKAQARYLVFFCADELGHAADGSGRYYESIGLDDVFHPQTILAYGMNGGTLPVAHGAPLRLRVERMLGYKMAKYVMRIEAVSDLSSFGRGKGSYWADRGYEWYAGI